MVAATQAVAQNVEHLGPAERIIETCLSFQEHVYHGRPGLVIAKSGSAMGVTWKPVAHVVELQRADGTWVSAHEFKDTSIGQRKVVVAMPDMPAAPAGPKKARKGRAPKGARPPATRIGVLHADGRVLDDAGALVGRYQPPGLFPEACAWLYRQVAEVWRLDNIFAARWASYAWAQEHEDLRLVLCALMLCQSRVGKPITDKGKLLFHDANLRDVGTAMMLLGRSKADHSFDAKMIFRIRQLLALPQVVAINHELGFAHGPRSKALKGWKRAARAWLAYRERNPSLLAGLVRIGFSSTVRMIAQTAEYKGAEPSFYRALRWEQTQDAGGHREVAIDMKLEEMPTWEGRSEEQICEAIVKQRLNWKRVVGMLPASMGATRAIVAATIESGGFSDEDLVIATPTLEELGLLEVQEIKGRWEQACERATSQRALHIKRNVTTEAVADTLQKAGEGAMRKAVEEAAKDMEVFVFVDRSGSQQRSLEASKKMLSKFVYAFPKERLHVAHFNSIGQELHIPHASEQGVINAFLGVHAGGSTSYGQGVLALSKYVPAVGRDVLYVFVGDEEAWNFAGEVRATRHNPVAFALLKMPGERGLTGDCVRATAQSLGVPCFLIEQSMFEDASAIPRTIRRLIESAPAAPRESRVAPRRRTLLEQILETELLAPPAWA